jgi:hypothetical protein
VKTDILNAPSHRPERFGGASSAPITPPPGFSSPGARRYQGRSPEDVAAMTMEAIRMNRPLVITDSSMREIFESYAADVRQAFDEAEAFEGAHWPGR